MVQVKKALLENIKILVMDVDGVLTDGTFYLGGQGEVCKAFNAQDGLGIKIALKVGLAIVVISGRQSPAMVCRAQELGIKDLYLGEDDKLEKMKEIWLEKDLTPKETAFIGDDLNDLALLKEVGLACTVPNGVPEVKDICHLITEKKGGKGAVRELIELILQCQGRWPY